MKMKLSVSSISYGSTPKKIRWTDCSFCHEFTKGCLAVKPYVSVGITKSLRILGNQMNWFLFSPRED